MTGQAATARPLCRVPARYQCRVEIDGFVAPGFEPVAVAFERNFEELGDLGAGVAVYHHGRLVADLAGGADVVRERPFTQDSLVMVASCTKGAMATCVLMLAEAGAVDLDEPVATYWPEFAQAGKAAIPVRSVLAHTAGLPFPDPDADLAGMDQLAGPALVEQLARQAPWWEPGTAFAYHPITIGAMLGEVVRRVTGQTLGRWFAEHVAEPLGLDFWIGLPAELDDRVVPSVWPGGRDGWDKELAAPPPPAGTYAARRRAAIARLPPMSPDPHDPASRRAYHGIEVPAAHGIANARSLARMYAAMLDHIDGIRLLSPAMVAAAAAPQTDGLPALVESGTAGPDIRFGLGFQLASSSMPGLTPASFGHTGAGGRLGLADPELGIAFGYVCNGMREIGPGGDPRWATLLEAVRACV
jgi:CubicO group peptidase (beta-lactamase class C family)